MFVTKRLWFQNPLNKPIIHCQENKCKCFRQGGTLHLAEVWVLISVSALIFQTKHNCVLQSDFSSNSGSRPCCLCQSGRCPSQLCLDRPLCPGWKPRMWSAVRRQAQTTERQQWEKWQESLMGYSQPAQFLPMPKPEVWATSAAVSTDSRPGVRYASPINQWKPTRTVRKGDRGATRGNISYNNLKPMVVFF